MCLLIVLTPGAKFSPSECAAASHANPHGFGLSYITDAGNVKVETFRELKPTKQARRINTAARRSWVVAHWRLSTGGEGLHPFALGRDLRNPDAALAHNGVLNIPKLPGLSDTATLAQTLNNRKVWSAADAAVVVSGLGREVLLGSKLAILDAHGVEIVNEEAGDWERGVWRSNRWHDWRAWHGRTYVTPDPGHCAAYIEQRSGDLQPLSLPDSGHDDFDQEDFWRRISQRELADLIREEVTSEELEYFANQRGGWSLPCD